MARNLVVVLGLALLLLFGAASAAPTSSPAKIVQGIFSNVAAALVKWLSSVRARATTKTAIAGRPMMKFESGYTVETVFDGSKLGIEPHSVEVLPSGELLILDSASSNLYRMSSSLSLYSRPKLVAGSPAGYAGHVDGKPREAKMNHPKGLTVDDKGNIYIADTMNMAIRKISDSGVTTIAGGKWGKGGGHVDGPSEDAKFSDDFDVVYIGSSCSLLVIDRGNRAIREIHLHFDDCAYQYDRFAVLLGAGFFGYMLALLQYRVSTIVSSQNEKQEEGFFGSLFKLLMSTRSSALEIMGGVFPSLRKKSIDYQPLHEQQYYQQQKHPNAWPVQESFVIPDGDEPPSIETRDQTPKKTYPFMSKDAEKMHHLRQSRAFYNGWDGDLGRHPQKQQHHHRYHSSIPHTYYEQSFEKTNEVIFGAVQEQEARREATVIKPVDYGNPIYDHHNIRSRMNAMGYRGY
ncbi:uncharacterized protein LOC115687489 isoform X6 [Syzygium oleosum]|uniref:uncharacterized protein LOC115687489 isoform X6 n=1 Tax=Syzygium oleosum TaxID=219896 RepID=UPI0024BB3999|nr:uncharacterized protein LOC115687489 isoform X6 [Syzygium oleosum]